MENQTRGGRTMGYMQKIQKAREVEEKKKNID